MAKVSVEQALERIPRPNQPSPEFRASLLAALHEELGLEPAREPIEAPRPARPRFRITRPRLVAVAATTLLALISTLLWIVPRPQSALAVIERAEEQLAAAPPFRAAVAGSSGVIAEEISPAPEGGPYRFEHVIWYDGEAGWRRDVVEESPPGLRGGPGSFAVWDGTQLGEYLPDRNEFLLNSDVPEERIPPTEMSALPRIEQLWFGPGGEGEARAFIDEACTVGPDEKVAGRAARHLSCRETRTPEGILQTAALDIWVDAEYGLVLKFVHQDPHPGRSVVTRIEFNPSFPPDIFRVAPPPGAKVVAVGPGPLPPEFRVRPDPEVTATIPVASGLGMVEVGFGSVWLADGNFTVRRIDPATGEILAAIRGNTLDRLVVGEGAVWMAQCRIDPATNDFGGQLKGLGPAGDEDCRPRTEKARSQEEELDERSRGARNRYVVAAGKGAVWAVGLSDPPAEEGDSLYRIDPRTGEVVASLPLGATLAGWAPALGDDALWLASSTGERGRLVRIDTRTNKIAATVELDRPLGSVAVGEGAVWVTTRTEWDGPGSLIRIDPTTNRVVATIDLGRKAGAVAVGGGFVWVANRAHDTVTKMDPKSNRVIGKPIVVGGEPADIAAGPGALWIANHADGTLARIDL